jgi:tRNA-2-methylthio-N6-dimethylallyladenosine synthase
MPDQVPQNVIEERHARLLDTVNQVAQQKLEVMVGRQVQVLVEGPSRRNEARVAGRTRCNKIVVFEGSERHWGQLLDVRIQNASLTTLYGDPAVINLDG